MNTIQIDKKLDNVEGFLGAFPYDQIPKSKKKMFSLVINTSSSHEAGDHWLALVYKDGTYYFMDSYGRNFTDLTFPEDFRTIIKKYIGNKKSVHNKKLLQQLTSNTCGEYAIYFVYMLSNNTSLKNSLRVFNNNLKYNDEYITRLIMKNSLI